MRYVVADANVLIRALIKSQGSDAQIFRWGVDKKINLCFSLTMIREIKKVASYPRIKKKYEIAAEQEEIFFKNLLMFGNLVIPQVQVSICRDKMNNEILSVAATLAQNHRVWLVTGDKDILVLKGKIPGVEILTAGKFVASIKN